MPQGLLESWSPKAVQAIDQPEVDRDPDFSRRLDDYFIARDIYLRAEIELRQGHLARAVESHLSSVRASPDFLTSYAQLLRLAQERSAFDQTDAVEMLTALERARPDRPEARQMLESLAF